MDSETTSSTEEIAATLNFCDRVEILNMMMHNDEKPLTPDGMDILLGAFYPSYRKLCEDLRGNQVVSSAQVSLNEKSVSFSVRFDNGEKYSAEYNQLDDQC